MTFWALVKEAGAIASAALVLIGVAGWLVKPRVVEWFRREVLNPVQETHHQVTVNGHKSPTPTVRDQVDTLTDTGRSNADALAALRDELHDHGEKSRAAMAIYRAALSDQGIHLPVAPGEDGYGIHHEEGKHQR